jgi:hypothetical protein
MQTVTISAERAASTKTYFEPTSASLASQRLKLTARRTRRSKSSHAIPLVVVLLMIGLPSTPARADGTSGGSGSASGGNDTSSLNSTGPTVADANASLNSLWAAPAISGSWAGAPGGWANASMAYDAGDGYDLMDGGYNGQAGPGGDIGLGSNTWNYSKGVWYWLLGTDGYQDKCWVDPPNMINTASCPSPRMGAAMTYDAHDGYVLLYGGCSSLGTSQNACNGPLSDTWEWKSGGWTLCTLSSCTGSNEPSARTGAAMAYATLPYGPGGLQTYSAVFLFGGTGACGLACSDTWTYSGGTWTQLSISGPSGRSGAVMTYDATAKALVLFGGDAGASPGTLSDAWKLYCTGIAACNPTWASLSPSCNPSTCPPSRSNASFAYSYADGDDVLSGGWEWYHSIHTITAPFALSDSWALVDSSGTWTWTEVCGSGSGSGETCPFYPRWGAATATEGTTSSSQILMADGAGFQQNSAGAPQQCYGGVAANRNLGWVNATCYLAGTWETPGLLTGGWNESHSSIYAPLYPSPRRGDVMTQAEGQTNDYVVLFGGLSPSGTYLGDTWIYYYPYQGCTGARGSGCTFGAWIELGGCGDVGQPECAEGTAPGARANASFTYRPDPPVSSTPGYDVLFGGCDPCAGSSSVDLSDTWTFVSGTAGSTPTGTWTSISSSLTPTARQNAQFVYNRTGSNGAFVLFGGYGCTGSSCSSRGYLSDTWSFTSFVAPSTYTPSTTGTWTQLSSVTCHPSTCPSSRSAGGFAWDQVDGMAIMFGGQGSSYFGDTWEFVGSTASAGTWTELQAGVPAQPGECYTNPLVNKAVSPCPQPRAFFGMDMSNGGGLPCLGYSGCNFPILFGGISPTSILGRYALDGDLWYWEIGSASTGNWTSLCGGSSTPACGIGARANFGFTGGTQNYYASGVLAGGYVYEPSPAASIVFAVSLVSAGGALEGSNPGPPPAQCAGPTGPSSYCQYAPIVPDWSQ